MRILVGVEAVDGRKGIDSLARLCQERLQTDPFSGCLFVFRSRRGTAVRILVYDGQGFWLAQKRLEVGTFQFPFAETGRKELAAWELAVLLEGIDLSQGKRRKRYTLPAAREPEEAEKAGGEASAS